MNDFASGMLAGGPNAFLDCDAKGSLGAMGNGRMGRECRCTCLCSSCWLQLVLDFSRAQGAGWTAANSIIWNSTAQSLDAAGPPDARNFVVNSTFPLYETELAARTGMHLAKTLPEPIAAALGIPEFRTSDIKTATKSAPMFHPLQIVNGRFVVEGDVLWGSSQTEAWWRGATSPYTAALSTGSSDRFYARVIAPGETEDLNEMVARMKGRNTISIQVNPGLWYEHRRDAHTVERRADGDVWAPFYEVPKARSAARESPGTASVSSMYRNIILGCSRASESSQPTPAKPASSSSTTSTTPTTYLKLAPTGSTTPGDRQTTSTTPVCFLSLHRSSLYGRNDVGNEFYSTEYAPLRETTYRAYILHTLDELGDLPNVILGIAYQYAGPL